MAYRFKSPDNIEADVRRIASDQLAKAIRSIDDSASGPAADVDKAVHDVRKRCKKVRGLIRLVRPAFPGYSKENTRFRDAARVLSCLRDAATLVNCADGLIERFEQSADVSRLRTLREKLKKERDRRKGVADPSDRLAECREMLAAGIDSAESWSLDDDGAEAIRGGLEKTYARGRTTMQTAYADPTAEQFHEWRKRVKYSWYHMRLMAPAWPGVIGPLAAEFKALSEILGDDHDLAVLRGRLCDEDEPFGPIGRWQATLALIDTRRTELQAAAHPLGRKLYAEKPARFARRLARIWWAWGAERTIHDAIIANTDAEAPAAG